LEQVTRHPLVDGFLYLRRLENGVSFADLIQE
jgi:hypothetical protein